MSSISTVSIRGGSTWELVTKTIAAVLGTPPEYDRNDPMCAASAGLVCCGAIIIEVTDNEPADGTGLTLQVNDLAAAAERLTAIEADFDPDADGWLRIRAGALRVVVTPEPDGQDIESRALLYRVVQLGAEMDRALRAIPSAAAKRIGLPDESFDPLQGLRDIAGRALWSSTADLNQRGEHVRAAQVVARARELAIEVEHE